MLQQSEKHDLEQRPGERAYRPDVVERTVKVEAQIDKQIEKALARLANLKEYKRIYVPKTVARQASGCDQRDSSIRHRSATIDRRPARAEWVGCSRTVPFMLSIAWSEVSVTAEHAHPLLRPRRVCGKMTTPKSRPAIDYRDRIDHTNRFAPMTQISRCIRARTLVSLGPRPLFASLLRDPSFAISICGHAA